MHPRDEYTRMRVRVSALLHERERYAGERVRVY
jgi:hypothetical protein